MTDKVQKIRAEVERLYNQSLADENRQADRGLERAANVSYGKSKACKEILSFIDSLPEESVSEDEIEKQFKAGDVVVYVSRQPAYSGLYLLGNPNDLSIGYSNANEPYQIALRNCTVASEDERKQFMRELDSNGYKWNEDTLRIEKEEPVSEDLKAEIKSWLDEGLPNEEELVEHIKETARHFAEWQMQQIFKLKDGVELFSEDESDNFEEEFAKTFGERKEIIPRGETFTEYDLYKMALHFCGWKQRQMMKNAIDGHVTFEFYGLDSKTYGTIAHDPICLDDFGLKDTDKVKVKVIVIKED